MKRWSHDRFKISSIGPDVGKQKVLPRERREQELEEDLSPPELGEELLRRTRESRLSNVPVNSKYRELNNNAKLRRRSSINHDSETSLPAPFGVEDFAEVDVGD